MADPLNASEIKTGRLTLKPYTRADDARTVAWLNSEELRGSFGTTGQVTIESHREWMERAKDVMVWTINLNDYGHCGNVLLHCNWRHYSAYFQIYLGESKARGHGVGAQVLDAVLAFAFSSLNLHRVWLHTLPGNVAAERLYAGAGFVNEGTERESIHRAGRFISQTRWSILDREWQGRRSEGGG